MTPVATKVERSGPGVRAALAEFAPAECAAFEAQFRQALVDAAQAFELGPVEAVLDRWWGIAAIRANPLSPAEQERVAWARTGNDSGWSDGPAPR